MPRKPRAEIAGGIYHVYARGAVKQTIFIDNQRSADLSRTAPEA